VSVSKVSEPPAVSGEPSAVSIVVNTPMYIYLKLTLSPPMTPPTPDHPPPTITDLIPTLPPVPKFRVSQDG
jgi:hypothetical protein